MGTIGYMGTGSKSRVDTGSDGRAPDARGTVSLGRYLSDQARTILDGRTALLEGADPVHGTRVAIRRLRATLRVYAEFLDLSPADVSHLDAELSWYAGVWGAVRDIQVQRPILAAVVADLPLPAADRTAAADAIDAALGRREDAARAALSDTFASDRHRALAEALGRWAEDPPTHAAVRVSELTAAADRAADRAHRRTRRAIARGEPDLIHRARKTVKRARYANEVAGSGQRRMRRRLRRLTGLQDGLGEYQDAVVTAEFAESLAAEVDPPTVFVLGMVHLRALDRAGHLRRQAIEPPS